jgi:hypothetical protein
VSVRSRIRNALIGAGTLLGGAGVIVVSTFPPSPSNLGLDCRLPAGAGTGSCVALLEPPPAQCASLMFRGGEPPGGATTDGFTAAQTKVTRALEAARTNNVIDTWHCESATIDAGSACWCEMRGSVIVNADGTVDGQAPAWRDVIDAAGTGSIMMPGPVSTRPAYALRSGCRAHVYAGEDPCAGSSALADTTEPAGQ